MRVFAIFFLVHNGIWTQNISHSFAPWLAFISETRVHNHWSAWNDVHWANQSFFMARHGITRHFPLNFSATAGYAWLFLGVNGSLERPEHRPWGQITWNNPSSNRVQWSLRYRHDVRFRQNILDNTLVPGFQSNQRLRFMSSVRIPILNSNSHKNKPFLSFAQECILSTPSYHSLGLDQQRVWAMFGLAFSNTHLQMGYMFRYQPDQSRIFHHFTCWVNARFDLNHKKNLPQQDIE
jgi:hypothetical protein